MVTIMTALWFDHLRGPDRVSVKPYASPVLHAIEYLLTRHPEQKSRASVESRRHDQANISDFPRVRPMAEGWTLRNDFSTSNSCSTNSPTGSLRVG
jgi:pyruvate dehydrogenase complex dehydrogenase (E1) component